MMGYAAREPDKGRQKQMNKINTMHYKAFEIPKWKIFEHRHPQRQKDFIFYCPLTLHTFNSLTKNNRLAIFLKIFLSFFFLLHFRFWGTCEEHAR